jgi:cytochrome c oxidase subunit II
MFSKKNYKNFLVDLSDNVDVGTMNILNGALVGVLSVFLIYILISFNVFSVWSWQVGFIDPSTAFAESLIRLYNFIWSFLMLVLAVVLILMVRIIYLFNWNSKLEQSLIINKFIFYCFQVFLSFSLMVGDKNLVSYCLKRLNELSFNSTELNVWYSNYKKSEFLSISDLSEYKQLEFIWCILPAGILCLIAGPSFSLVFSLDSSIDPEINIQVTGKQWYWVYSFDNVINLNDGSQINKTFNYDSVMVAEDDLKQGTHRLLEVDNRLLIPVGVPVRFLITATDVLHSWAVPSLGLKVDAVPGRLNQFIVEIKKPGVYYGQCSELCGLMHGFMPITLQAVTLAEYKNWLLTL